MNKSELKIRQLVDQSNYQKFEINILMTWFFSLLAILVAIFIGFYAFVEGLLIRIFLLVAFLVAMAWLLDSARKKMKPRELKIRQLSHEIDALYDKLLGNKS